MSLRDRNRAKITYPYIRVSPRDLILATDLGVARLEVIALSFNNDTTKTHTFSQTFPTAPIITGISVDSNSNSLADVNVWVSAISTTSVTLDTSAALSGSVHFHAIYRPGT